jgi:hypothetical protein
MKKRLQEMESSFSKLKAVLSLPNVTIKANGAIEAKVTLEQLEKLKKAFRNEETEEKAEE